MSSARENREEFIARMAREGWRLDIIRATLRDAQTLHRLAEAQCNGDWPADHGSAWETAECPRCGAGWHPSVLKGKDKLCPDCRTEDRMRARLPEGWGLRTQGDPRGYTARVYRLDAELDINGDPRDSIGVPTV